MKEKPPSDGMNPSYSSLRSSQAGYADRYAGRTRMLAIPVVHVVLYSLVVSGVLIWLNIRGAGPVGAAAGTIVACVAIGIFQFFVYGQATVSRQAVQFWPCFVLLPGAVVFGISRLGWLRNNPWSLLLLGPLCFVLAVVLGMVTYNVLFASRQAR